MKSPCSCELQLKQAVAEYATPATANEQKEKKKKEELEGAEQMVRRVRERKLLIQAFSCSPVISRLQINPANWFVP